MKKLLIISILCLGACTQEPYQLRKILQAEGITNIELTGYSLFGCSDNDTFKTGFKGIKNGVPIEGVVCSGWLKEPTVRYHARPRDYRK